MELSKLRFSKSGIATYESCPYKFKLTYVDGLRDEGGAEAQLGTALHTIYDQFYKEFPITNETKREDIVKNIMSYGDGIYKKHLESFASFNLQMFDSLKDKRNCNPIQSEKKIHDSTLSFTGVVDVIFSDDDGDSIILDWKTGKMNPYEIEMYRFELSCYYYLALLEGKITPPKKWGIFFSKENILWQEKVIDGYFEANVIPSIQEIHLAASNNEFPPKISPLCMWCGHKQRCLGWGGIKDPRIKT